MKDRRHILSGINVERLPPIALRNTEIDTGGYQNIPVDRQNELYDEELVDLADYGIAGLSYYHQSDGQNPPYGRKLKGSIPRVLARKSISKRLVSVNESLRCLGLELFVWDAYRPLATQKCIWQFFVNKVRAENHKYDSRAIYKEVVKYVSDHRNFAKDNSKTWPTHMTGASVDVTIRTIDDSKLLDMGAHFDQMDQSANSDFFERLLAQQRISDDDSRLINRRLLHYVMKKAGFSNYPMEYWHFDWGNQMYRFVETAIYGEEIQPAIYGIVFVE